MNPTPVPTAPGGPAPLSARHVGLATFAFFVNFAAWGSIATFAPRFRDLYGLSATATSLLVAVPVLLGSLARLPMGLAADRFGGRKVFAAATFAVALPVALVPLVESYALLLTVAFFVGIAGSTFPVGVGYVSRWTSRDRQGAALGIYGVGNLGHSAVVFLGPLVAAALGLPAVYQILAGVLVVWGLVWTLTARDAPAKGAPAGGAALRRILGEPTAWALSLFYFLTFGGFVAFGIYLPTLLRDDFALTPADAGFRTAGFVLVATLLRPVGGILADRVGGATVLSYVFLGTAPFAMLLAWPSMVPFTIGALACAALMGLGNGAVFKLVPQAFPDDTGTATGLVGAMGGLGGFFPPLLLGIFRDSFGVIWPGFALLAAVSLWLALLNRRMFLPAEVARRRPAASTAPG
jgi:NNP family nitrate/nitrite transporter-like MFS transporter